MTEIGLLDRAAIFGLDRVPIYRGDKGVILKMNVKGGYFPATTKERAAARTSVFNLKFLEEDSIGINFHDGTGWNTYQSVGKEIKFYTVKRNTIDNGVDEETINYSRAKHDVYFYDDVDEENKFDYDYDKDRVIEVRINDINNVNKLTLDMALYGELSPEFSKLRRLNTLEFLRPEHLTGFSSDFTKVFVEKLSMQELGFSFGHTTPDFVINSPLIKSIAVRGQMDLSGHQNSLDSLFNSENLPQLNSFDLSDCKIDFQLPNLQRNMFGKALLYQNKNGFKFSKDLSTYNFKTLTCDNSYVGKNEFKRLLEDSNVVKLYNTSATGATDLGINEDFNLDKENNSVQLMFIGNNDSYGGTLPEYLTKLNSLTELRLSIKKSKMTLWGESGLNDNIKIIRFLDRGGDFERSFPGWLNDLPKLEEISNEIRNQPKLDEWVSGFYDFIISLEENKMQGFKFNTSDNYVNSYTSAKRPSGKYRQKSTPETPMEKIYSLVNDYGIIVKVVNEANDGTELLTP